MRSPHERLSRTLLLTLVLSCAAGLLVTPLILGRRPAPPLPSGVAAATPKAPGAQALETFGRVPLSFEANQGQAEASVDFVARGAGYALFLKPTEAVFVLRNADSGLRNEDGAADHPLTTDAPRLKANPHSAIRNPQSKVLRMKLVGADASAEASGAEELAGKANYIVGADPARWRTNVPTFGRVGYARVYEGVDVVYYGNQRQLEYDFRVAPGADPRAVALQFEGADKVEVNASGDLLLTLGGSVVRQPKPFIYQEAAGGRREVEGGYEVAEGGRVRFNVGEYDPQLPLVIDPTIVYSTYLGGSGADQANGVGIDSSGNVYVAGFTASTNFPTANAIQAANGDFQDAFVAKLNPTGTALVYSTYLGGSASEQARGLAVDSAGNAYVTGFTGSTNFPLVNAAQGTFGGNGQDVFVSKLNPTGSALVYSTFLGGDGALEFGEGIAVDSAGTAYVTGVTNSTDFPTLNPIQSAHAGGGDVFLTKLNVPGNAFVYSTYLGGSDFEIGKSVAVDSLGAAYVTGETASTNYPRLDPIQATYGGGDRDGFVTKVNAAGTALVYSTFLGGTAQDSPEAIAVDSPGNAYVAGVTFSTDYPTANAIQPANGFGGGTTQDAFVTKLNIAGSTLVYSTYLGGSGGEIGFGIAVDSSGAAYVVGATSSPTTFPTANAIQCARSGSTDAFITKLNPAGNAYVYSTYLGGSGSGVTEAGRAVAIDSSGNAYVAGGTNSTDFPTVTPIQSAFAGGDGLAGDAFVLKLSDATTGAASGLQFTQTSPTVQEDVTTLTLTVQRTGDTTGAVTVDYATADGTASERSDYTTAVGTLRFAAGQTSQTIDILVNEDSFAEGPENFTVTLSNPTGGAAISCLTAVATVQITDDASEPATNVIDDATVFVGQHYHDFLNRQADAPGLNFWTGQIAACGSDPACIDRARTNVSQAFFLSIEFQQTGYLVFRFYKASFTDTTQRPRGMPRYREFLRDTQEIGRGVQVGVGDWPTRLEANKQAFALAWVQRPEFVAQFPPGMSAAAFVDKLFQNSEVTPTTAERNAAIDAFGSGDATGRANALRSVADSGSVYNRQFNPAFVLAQYIGYLRRNPNDAPEAGLDYAGFDFWLTKMNGASQPGEDVRNEGTAVARANRAEMVRAFVISTEYRGRFGQP